MSMQEALVGKTRRLDEQTAGLDESVRAGGIAELAARQRRILDLGLRLADKIRGQGQAQPRVSPEEDGLDEGPDAPIEEGPREGGSREEESREEGGGGTREDDAGADGRNRGVSRDQAQSRSRGLRKSTPSVETRSGESP
jgi:hypothetical protein